MEVYFQCNFLASSSLTTPAASPCVYLFVKCHEVHNSPRCSQKQVNPLMICENIHLEVFLNGHYIFLITVHDGLGVSDIQGYKIQLNTCWRSTSYQKSCNYQFFWDTLGHFKDIPSVPEIKYNCVQIYFLTDQHSCFSVITQSWQCWQCWKIWRLCASV